MWSIWLCTRFRSPPKSVGVMNSRTPISQCCRHLGEFCKVNLAHLHILFIQGPSTGSFTHNAIPLPCVFALPPYPARTFAKLPVVELFLKKVSEWRSERWRVQEVNEEWRWKKQRGWRKGEGGKGGEDKNSAKHWNCELPCLIPSSPPKAITWHKDNFLYSGTVSFAQLVFKRLGTHQTIPSICLYTENRALRELVDSCGLWNLGQPFQDYSNTAPSILQRSPRIRQERSRCTQIFSLPEWGPQQDKGHSLCSMVLALLQGNGSHNSADCCCYPRSQPCCWLNLTHPVWIGHKLCWSLTDTLWDTLVTSLMQDCHVQVLWGPGITRSSLVC